MGDQGRGAGFNEAGRAGGSMGGGTRLASVTGYRTQIIYKPIGQPVLVKVEEGELHPRDCDRLPGVAPHKPEPEGRFVRGRVCTTQVVVGSVQVDLPEVPIDSIYFVMASAVTKIVVIRGVLDVHVDGRVRARDEEGTLGFEDVSEDCARRATR